MSDPASREKSDRLRICTIKEIVDTERGYLQTLEFIACGVEDKMRESQSEHPEFTEELIESVVLNANNLYKLHTTIVAAFDSIVADGVTPQLKIAPVFLQFKNELRIEYSTYGSNYERAQSILTDIVKRDPYKTFFQTQLSTLGKTATIANVQGLFLSPVQRVCKYPLLMRELTKHTDSSNPDYEDCKNALEIMKEVCSVINEARRRMEKLEEIMDWQAGVEGWEGPNLVDTCDELLKWGVLLKITSSKAQERHFFLFDHLLVSCKKVEGKRKRSRATSGVKGGPAMEPSTSMMAIGSPANALTNMYQFKGSILLDMLEIDEMVERPGFVSNNVHFQYGWRIQDREKKKAFMCMAQSIEERKEWVDAILNEREKVRAFKLNSLQDSYVLIAARGDRVYKAMRKTNIIRDHKKEVIGSGRSDEPKCFTGMGFVQYMLDSKECRSEEEAVDLGCSLVSNGIVHHVSDKYHFKNENFLYRFRFDDGTFEARVETNSLMRKALQFYVRLHLLINPIIRDVSKKLGSAIRNALAGKELVDFLVDHNDFSSREGAIACCEELLGENLIQHVDGRSNFRDRDDMYYRFCTDVEHKDRGDLSASDTRQQLVVHDERTTRSINIRPRTDTLGFSINSSRPNVVSSVHTIGIAAKQGLPTGATLLTVNGRPLDGLGIEAIVGMLKERSTWLTLTYATTPTEMKVLEVNSGELFGFAIGGSQPVSITNVIPDTAASRAGLFTGLAISQVEKYDMQQATLPAATKLLFNKNLEDELDMSAPCITMGPSSVPSIVVDSNARASLTPEDSKMLSWFSDEVRMVEMVVSLPDIIYNAGYKYTTATGSNISVTERSIESLFSYKMPALLYSLWVEEDWSLAEDVGRLLDMMPANNPFSSSLTKYHRKLLRHVDTYRQFEKGCRKVHFPSFKGVKDAARVSHAGCPMNCHVYELDVNTATINGDASRSVYHSVVCASPSTVHQMGTGGLQTQVSSLDMILGYRETLANCRHQFEKLSQAVEAVRRNPQPDVSLKNSLVYGSPSTGISNSSHSLSSVTSNVSEDEDSTNIDFGNLNLGSRGCSGQDRSMSFCSEASKYLSGCVNKSTVNAFLTTDGILTADAPILRDRKSSVSQFLDLTISPQQKAITSSISSANALLKDNERVKESMRVDAAKYELGVFSIFDNINLLNNEIVYRLLVGIAQEDDLQLIQRRDAVFSQVLSSFLTGFVAKLEAAIAGELNPLPEYNSDSEVMSSRWLLQLAECGIVADYELIVDPTVDGEMAMLEDAVPAVSQLANVTISIRRWTANMSDDEKSWDKSTIAVCGSRNKLEILIYLDDHRYEKLPPSLQKNAVKLTPCVFSSSLHTLSREAMASSEGRRTFQVSCNITSVDRLRDYYKTFRSCILDKSRLPENPEDKMVEIDRLLKPLHTLSETISALNKTVEYGKGDSEYNSAAVLALASEVTHRCGGVRISTSRNGYGRNSYTTSLDSAMLLCRSHELPLLHLRKASDLLRAEGVLLKNVNKNGLVKYPIARELLPICTPPASVSCRRDESSSQLGGGLVKKRGNKSIFRKNR